MPKHTTTGRLLLIAASVALGCSDDAPNRDVHAGGSTSSGTGGHAGTGATTSSSSGGSGAADAGGGGIGASGPLPEGDTGIAADYPDDVGIEGAPGVLFTDDFENVASPQDLRAKWDSVFHEAQLRVATEPEHVNGGARALEMIFPQSASAVGNGLMKKLAPERDILFLRFHTKFDAGLNIEGAGSFHNGGSISAHYHVDGQSTPGVPADGYNKFLVSYESTVWSGPPPGHLIAYVYHPEQRSQWGDIFFPTGEVSPNTSLPGNFGDDFLPRPNVVPELGRWHCFEMMVKANTPGERDGRIGLWLDGNLVADFPNMRFRDIATLTIDYLTIGGYINPNQVRDNRLWFDDVVAAVSYIGPRRAPR